MGWLGDTIPGGIAILGMSCIACHELHVACSCKHTNFQLTSSPNLWICNSQNIDGTSPPNHAETGRDHNGDGPQNHISLIICSGRIRTMSLKCNLCWSEIKDRVYVTSCRHCFCGNDARRCFANITVSYSIKKTCYIQFVYLFNFYTKK